jgi:hypothetical protein
MVYVGAVIINPNFFCPWVFAGRFVVENNNICFYSIGILNTGGQG